MQKQLITILPCLMLMFQPLNAKVETPNYNFSIETLSDFYPGKPISDLSTKYGNPKEMNSVGGMKTQKFEVAQLRYKFPVLVQEKNGAVHDFFARLPSYFLHDIFLQTLVNKLGKQNSYKKTGEEAFYVWEQNDLKHVYSAACTITCFPIFYAVGPLKPKTPTLLEQMTKASKGE